MATIPNFRFISGSQSCSVWFGWTLDNAVSYSQPREGSTFALTPSGVEDAWTVGTDYYTEGDLRWIPYTSSLNPTRTGWDDSNGVRAWLEYAREGNIPRSPSDATPMATVVQYISSSGHLSSSIQDGTGRTITGMFHKASDTLDNVSDGTGSFRQTVNEKSGSQRAFTALDTGNVLVASALDFSRSYTNKHAGNIPRTASDTTPLSTVVQYISSSGHLSASIQDANGRTVAGMFHKTSDTLDSLNDGTTYKRTTVNEKSGSQRAFAALDTGNVLVTSSLDFSRGYTNKNATNLPRVAGGTVVSTVIGRLDNVGNLSGSMQDSLSRTVNVFFSKTSDDLDDVDTSISVAKTVTSTEKSGSGWAYLGLDSTGSLAKDIPAVRKVAGYTRTLADVHNAVMTPAYGAQNLVENAGFENAGTDGDLAAGWKLANIVGSWAAQLDSTPGFFQSGQQSLYLSYNSGQTVPANTWHFSDYQQRRQLRVRPGETYNLSAYIYAARSISIPAGISPSAFALLKVYFSGSTTTDYITNWVTDQTAGFVQVGASLTIPTGSVPLYAEVWLQAGVTNNTASPITIPAGLLWDVRFDSVELVRVTRLDDELTDGSTYARTTYNQRDGGDRAYNALTSNNQLTASVGAYDGIAVKVIAKNGQQGTARHSASVTYATHFQGTPMVTFYGGVNYEPGNYWGSGSQIDAYGSGNLAPLNQRVYADLGAMNPSSTGFTLRSRLWQKSTQVAQAVQFDGTTATVVGAVSTTTGSFTSAPSSNDSYTVRFGVTTTARTTKPGFLYSATYTVALEVDATGGGAWVERATASYSSYDDTGVTVTDTFSNENFTVSVSGVSSSAKMRLKVKSVSSMGTGVSTVALKGKVYSVDGVNGVSYNTSTGDRFASMTPDSTDFVSWTAIEVSQ